MTIRKQCRTATACIMIAMGFGTHAAAQMVDYGSLQALVGEPVTMDVTGTPQRAEDVAANMTIITADQIRQSGSRSIPEIISRVPGLDILRESTNSYDVGVRGYQQAMQPRLLVLIDGRQVFLDDYSRTVWENLPVNIDNIRQIVVVKGPSSALFGSNAAGGVINIITYSPLYDNSNTEALTYGTQHSLTGDATKTAKIGKDAGLSLSVGGMTGDEFDTPRKTGPLSEGSVTTDPQHRYVTASSVVRVTPTFLTDFEGTYAKSSGTEAYYNGQLAGVDVTTYSARGGFSWQTPYGTVKSNNYINHSIVENDEISATVPFYSDNANLIVSQLEDQFRLGKDHTFRISAEYQNKTFNLDAQQSVPSGATIYENNYALSGMWLWQINDKLSWTNAVREDRLQLGLNGLLPSGDPFTSASYNNTIDAFSANSGFVYKATDKDTFRLDYGRGIQMPSLLDYGFNSLNQSSVAGGGSIARLGNPDLDATVVTNYEAGYDRALAQILSTAKFSVFYENNSNIIAPFPVIGTIATPLSAATRVREPVNVGDSRGLGGEFQLVGKSDSGFRWDASYSYANVLDQAIVRQDFGYQDSTPMNHFRLLLGYTAGQWELDTNAQYMTPRTLFRLNSARADSPSYGSLGARIGYNVSDQITVSLSGTDLTRADTQESPYPAIERQVFLGVTTRF